MGNRAVITTPEKRIGMSLRRKGHAATAMRCILRFARLLFRAAML